MITSILAIIASVIPLLMEIFTNEAKKGRTDEAFDKALAKNDAASLAALLSARIDGVRK
jgi:hypothetical protein